MRHSVGGAGVAAAAAHARRGTHALWGTPLHCARFWTHHSPYGLGKFKFFCNEAVQSMAYIDSAVQNSLSRGSKSSECARWAIL